MNHHPRPMTGPELSALSAYLPEDLTPDQLEAVLAAASYATAQAHSAGYTAGQTITALRHQSDAEHRRRQAADTADRDERVEAWATITKHPFFADCLWQDSGTLLDRMMAKLGYAQTELTRHAQECPLPDQEPTQEAPQ